MGTGRSMRGSAPRPGGGNKSPRTPLIPPRGFAPAAGRGGREDGVLKEGEGEGGGSGRRRPGCRFSAGVSSRTRLPRPTSIPACAGTDVSKEGIVGAGFTEKRRLEECFFMSPVRLSFHPPLLNAISYLGESSAAGFSAFPPPLLPPFNARGPRATSGARPTVMNSRDSLAALSEMTVVQALRP